MSMRHQHIILYGYEVPYGTFTFDDVEKDEKRFDYRPKVCGEGDVVIVNDGRSGNYSYVGVLQYKSDRQGTATISPQKLERPKEDEILELGRVMWQEFDLSTAHLEPGHHVLTHTT